MNEGQIADGDTVTCAYTGAAVPRSEATRVGSPVPGIKGAHWMANTDEARALRAESVRLARAMDANCNTCRFFARVPHEKCKAGRVHGRCGRAIFGAETVLSVHPADPMFMKCWEGR